MTKVKLKVDTNKHEDLNLVLTNHGKEDKIYPLRMKYTLWLQRDNKSTIQRSKKLKIYQKNM
jgi:hypothetical protein